MDSITMHHQNLTNDKSMLLFIYKGFNYEENKLLYIYSLKDMT